VVQSGGDGARAEPVHLMADPYLTSGPTLVSFSGGRTSAYMLWRILQAHGGELPADCVVAFANTGREREETLRFVFECGSRWGVPIRWVEWRPPASFAEVGFNSADREGKWFAELVRRKQFLPNSQMRYCTSKLKIEPMKKLMLSLGYRNWSNPVGLRHDEGHRVLSQLARNASGKERFTAVMPLADDRVTKPDVLRFWLGENSDPKRLTHPLPQGFDLGLRDYEGNCDLCFLKGRAKRARLIRDVPGIETWWVEREASAKTSSPGAARFDADESVADLAAAVRAQPLLIDDDLLDDDDPDCTGLSCDDGPGGAPARRVLQRLYEAR
jgi:3'-phosphoadenosine 5'-phosphosulfate sulfotransferase (PAPS reductase)/FAD synthetase